MLTAPARSTSIFTGMCRRTPCGRCMWNWMEMTNLNKDVDSASSDLPGGVMPQPQTRLLLVDDDDGFRESLGLNLLDEGFAVAGFSNGADVLKFFEQSGAADVLLLDWRMPGMDGLEVLRQIRKRGIE